MTQIVMTPAAVPSFAFGPVLRPVVAWYRTYQTRKALRALSDHELTDIGLTRDAIETLQIPA